MLRFNFSTQQRSGSLFAFNPNLVSANPVFTPQITTTSLAQIETTSLCLSLPSFLRKWNVTGGIRISRRLEQSPSSAVIFYACKADECAIRLALPNGKRVNLFGLAFRISNFTVTLVAPDSEQIQVQLQLRSIHDSYGEPSRHPLDIPIKTTGDDCKDFGWRSLSSYAKKVGVKYIGKPIQIWVSRNTSSLATITIRQLLQRAIVNQQFLYYSHPERIEARDWGKTKLHRFNLDSYYQIQSHVFSGNGYLLPEYKVQLAKEYRNTEIQLASIEEIEAEDDPKITTRWEFENAKSLADCQTPAMPLAVGEQVYILKNPTTDILRDPTIAFDTGGATKTAHEIKEKNGLEVSRLTKTWGWIGTSLDNYTVINKAAVIATDQNYSRSVAVSDNFRVIFTPRKRYSFISSQWRQIAETKTIRKYDSNGYLIEEITTGKKLFRLKQDTSELAGIGTQLEALEVLKTAEGKTGEEKAAIEKKGNALLKLSQAYQFTGTEPIYRKTTYQLHPFSRYYSDITKPWAANCNWIEPKFAHHTLTAENRRIIEDNPGSTEEEPLLPIIKGKEFTEEIKVTITHKKKPERFVTLRFTSNKEGENLKQKLKIGGTIESIGRPSIHQRQEIIEDLSPTTTTGTFSNQKKIGEENKIYKYLLNSEGSLASALGTKNENNLVPTDSISFPNVYDINLAVLIAATKLSIDNTKEAEILTIKTLYNPSYQEGDRLLFEDKEYVILGIDYTIEIESKNFLKCADYTLTLGRLIQPEITLTKIKNTPTGILSSGNMTGLSAIDGNLAQYKSIYNYLSPSAIAAASELGLLDDFIEMAGLKVMGQSDFEETDDLESFLTSSLGSSSSSGSLEQLSSGSITAVGLGEGGELTDLRTKTDIDKFADLIIRSGLLNDFLSQLEEKLGIELLEKINQEAYRESGSEGSGSGGGGNLGLSGGQLVPGLPPNIILEGGDGLLEDMLNGLFGALDRLLSMLEGEVGEAGGGGGTPGGGGAGGSGGAGELGGGREPVALIGEKIIYLPSTDFDGLIALLLSMIAEAIALAQDFELTLPELLEQLLGKASTKNRPVSGGGGGGTAGGANAGVNTPSGNIEYIFPEGLEPATIRIIAPDEDLDSIDFSELFAALDELLAVLDELAQQKFDFSLNLAALTEQEEFSQSINPATGSFSASSTGSTSAGSDPLSSPSSNLTPETRQILVEIKDISGVFGGGVSPLPQRQKKTNTGAIASGSGGSATGNLTSGGSFSSGGGLSEPPIEYSGNIGEFNIDGWASNGEGVEELAVPFEGTDFSVTPVIPVDSGFYLPLTVKDDSDINLTENEFVTVPDDFAFTPLYEGDILLVLGTTASNLVEWEILDSISGVEILTPFDLEPTIEFKDNYAGDSLRLKLFLRGAPEIFEILTINTVPTSNFKLYPYNAISQLISFEARKVDINTLVPTPNVTGNQATISNVNLYRWQPPIQL